jgi:hypothetical protein
VVSALGIGQKGRNRLACRNGTLGNRPKVLRVYPRSVPEQVGQGVTRVHKPLRFRHAAYSCLEIHRGADTGIPMVPATGLGGDTPEEQRSRAAGGRQSGPLRAASGLLEELHNGIGRPPSGRPGCDLSRL